MPLANARVGTLVVYLKKTRQLFIGSYCTQARDWGPGGVLPVLKELIDQDGTQTSQSGTGAPGALTGASKQRST